MRSRARWKPTESGLDSLVDIVSNNVGIFVILAVFMALFSLAAPAERAKEGEGDAAAAVEKVTIPWARYSQKTSQLFLVRDNKLLFLDRAPVYEEMERQLRAGAEQGDLFEFAEYRTRTEVYSASVHCLDFEPRPGAGQWWHQALKAGSPLADAMARLNPSEHYFYFWVDANSFELFRDIRRTLWDRKYEVGWRPVAAESRLRYCDGVARSLSFQPQ